MTARLPWIALGVLLALSAAFGARLLAERPVPAAAEAAEARGGAPEAGAPGVLAQALAVEADERRKLAREVAALREEVLRLSVLLGYAELTEPEPDLEATADDAGDAAGEAAAADGIGADGLAGARFFDESLLIARGVDPDEARRLRERFEQAELDRLYLSDRAAREGWRFSPRMFREMQALSAELRAEVGDEAYDNILYASGRHNRIVVGDMLSGSPASRAGLEVGDVITAYDGRSVFDAHELRRATTLGESGAPTRVDLLRDGEPVTVYLPRGPLGVRLVPARREPAG